jgi:ribulose-5-phosphate 4-epimerase/fuculose-1-phosphate aldolase
VNETQSREAICRLGRSFFMRGLTFGATGNISIRLTDGYLMTPTGVSLNDLSEGRLARLDLNGALIAGDPPTKEAVLHRVMYDCRSNAAAVVHLHSTYSVAVSCLDGLDSHDVLPPLTAYYVMRVGRLPLIPYYPPGDLSLAEAVRSLASRHHAVLLANHGPVIAGTSLSAAADAIEELEETAKLKLLLEGHKTRPLSEEAADELRTRYKQT